MRRREFIGLLGGAAVCPLGARAQASQSRGKIGYLHPSTIDEGHPTLSTWRQAWRALGYVEGATVLLRSAGGDPQQLPNFAAEMIAEGAGVLIVVGAEAVRAVSKIANTTPIVAIDLETDPIRGGLAASFARPGGNVTGLFLDLPSLAGKWIELLLESAPNIERIAFGYDPASGQDQLNIATAVARAKDIEWMVVESHSRVQFEQAFQQFSGSKPTGFVQLATPGLVQERLAAAALKHRLPAIAFLKTYARAGILITYGPIREEYFQRAVIVADKILKGDKASDVPIEQPTRFELVVNLNTARALGLTLPSSILIRADEVIE